MRERTRAERVIVKCRKRLMVASARGIVMWPNSKLETEKTVVRVLCKPRTQTALHRSLRCAARSRTHIYFVHVLLQRVNGREIWRQHARAEFTPRGRIRLFLRRFPLGITLLRGPNFNVNICSQILNSSHLVQ